MKSAIIFLLAAACFTISHAQTELLWKHGAHPIHKAPSVSNQGSLNLQFRNDLTEKVDSAWLRSYDEDLGGWLTFNKSFFTYNSDNQLEIAFYVYIDTETGKLEYDGKDEYYYNELKLPDTYYYSDFNTDLQEWVRDFRESYVYDEDLNLTEVASANWDAINEEWVNYSKSTSSFSATGKETQRIYYNWDEIAGEWIEDLKTALTYNAQDYVERIDQYVKNQGTGLWDLVYVQHYVYDNQHFLVYQVNYEDDGSGLQLSDSVSYINNAQGLPTIQTYYSYFSDSGTWIEQILFEYMYTPGGNLSSYAYYSWNQIKNSWEGIDRVDYEYTPADDLASETQYSWDGDAKSWAPIYRDEYIYDENVDGSTIAWPSDPVYNDVSFNRKLLYSASYLYDEGLTDWLVTDTLYVFYSAITTSLNPVTFIEHNQFPNPASDEIHIQASSLSPVSKIEMYNLKGQLVHEEVLFPGKPVSVQLLVPGIYSYRIRNGFEWMTGKFIKQ